MACQQFIGQINPQELENIYCERYMQQPEELQWAETGAILAGEILPLSREIVLLRCGRLLLLLPLLVRSGIIPVEVTLDARDGMPTACVVNCDNLLTIPKSLLQSYICTLTRGKMQTVEQAIRFALALT